jgi:hypothetical protein
MPYIAKAAALKTEYDQKMKQIKKEYDAALRVVDSESEADESFSTPRGRNQAQLLTPWTPRSADGMLSQRTPRADILPSIVWGRVSLAELVSKGQALWNSVQVTVSDTASPILSDIADHTRFFFNADNIDEAIKVAMMRQAYNRMIARAALTNLMDDTGPILQNTYESTVSSLRLLPEEVAGLHEHFVEREGDSDFDSLEETESKTERETEKRTDSETQRLANLFPELLSADAARRQADNRKDLMDAFDTTLEETWRGWVGECCTHEHDTRYAHHPLQTP